ncbi:MULTISPECIES: Dyp-type peroxidase [unclassified Streptomyces]|uniref:Dyp-type peroxidase n=1 Tax=unclassified Streptomyces TaxID=2593676 RepID=UPI002E2A7A52|nr:peroxidase [Streptomyces sp. NBC_00223]
MAADLKLRESTEIQGDILAGFKKDHVTMLFLQFGDLMASRSWLEDITPQIATTAQVAAFNKEFSEARKQSAGDDPRSYKALWLGLGLTHEGLKFLTAGQEVFPRVPVGTTIEAFVQGPYERALALGDTDDSDPKHWLFGNNHHRTVHAVLTLAADSEAQLTTALMAQREAASRARALIVFEQAAATLTGGRRGKEHFGFKDGVSEPGVRGFDEEDPERKGYAKGHPGTRLIDAGEFVIGEEPSPAHSPDTYARKDMPAWMNHGSFQVIRRLEQDVPGWWAQVSDALRTLIDRKVVPQGTSTEWLAARMVGRWRSGASVAKCPVKPITTPDAEPDNDFSYADDPDGIGTPLFSHLRKSNPRDGLVDGGELVDEKFIDARRIIRRGAPYGQPFDPTSDDEGSSPDASRGLMFVSYQADLVGQFEFIQADWINDPDFPHGREDRPGPDAMVSGKLADTNDGKVSFESHSPSGERQATTLNLNQFVRTRGAVYAFAPAISTLRLLSQGCLNGESPAGR